MRTLKGERVVRTAVLSSAFFVASLIHIPFGPTSVHLVLNGLVGILLGWETFCAVFVALMLQAILFQFGGISSLGINTFNMAVPGVIVYYLFSRKIRKCSKGATLIGGFLAGFSGVFFGGVFLSLSLYLSGEQFLSTAKLAFVAHLPVMIIEGIITALVLQFICRVKPEMLVMDS